MDVRLSPEQVALRDSVTRVVDRWAPATVAQLDDADRAGGLEAAVAASGWRELRTAEGRAGGEPVASGVEVALVAEELGRGLADAPFLGPTLAAELRRLAGAPAAAGEESVALHADLSAPATALGGALGGPAVAVDARRAAAALVLLPVAGRFALAEVAVGERATAVDLTRPTATVAPAAAPIEPGTRSLGPDELARWSALGLALTSADLVGAMRGSLRLACGHAAIRKQYGVPIGSFQAIQHLLADAFVSMEGSASIALYAAWAVDALAPAEALVAAAAAKAYCARAARSVCETAVQVHGGIGNTWDCLAHVYLRRVLLSADVLGGVDANLHRVLAAHHLGTGDDGGADGLR